MKKTSLSILLTIGTIALAAPAFAGSDKPASFSALKDVRAERLSPQEMKSITGQGMISSTISALGSALNAAARK